MTGKLDAVHTELASLANSFILVGIADAPNPAEAFLHTPVERTRAIVDALLTVTVVPGWRGRKPRHVEGDYRDRVRIEKKDTV